VQAAAQEAEATLIVALLAAVAIVALWRAVIKYVIVIILTVIIATLGYGAMMIWQNMHHLAR
jgi:uncharacterized protein YacL